MPKLVSITAGLVWSSYETWGLFKTAVALVAAGAISGGGSFAVLVNAFSDWPLWQQLIASTVVALAWLTIMNFLVGLRKQHRKKEKNTDIHQEGYGHTYAGQGNESTIATTGGIAVRGDLHITELTRVLSDTDKYTLHDSVKRTVIEAEYNINRRGRQRRINIRRNFADMLYHHPDFLSLQMWPELAAAFEDYYENLTMQYRDGPSYNAYQRDDHYRKKIVEPAQAFIDAAPNYLDGPSVW